MHLQAMSGDHFEMHKSDFYPWTFPSLLALVGVTIEQGLGQDSEAPTFNEQNFQSVNKAIMPQPS